MPTEATRRICDVLASIPQGKASTYGRVAALAGLPNGARQVVRVLHSSAGALGLPWHRVLRKDGSIALPLGGGYELQKALLESEGIEVGRGGKVDLSRYGWMGGLNQDSDTSGRRTSGSRGLRGSPRAPAAREGRLQ